MDHIQEGFSCRFKVTTAIAVIIYQNYADIVDTNKRRPLLASDCQSLPEAEKWRRELVRDFTKKISAIQNGKHTLRQLSLNH